MRGKLLILLLLPLAANAASAANVTTVSGVVAECLDDAECMILLKWCSAERGTGQIVFAGLDASGKGEEIYYCVIFIMLGVGRIFFITLPKPVL